MAGEAILIVDDNPINPRVLRGTRTLADTVARYLAGTA